MKNFKKLVLVLGLTSSFNLVANEQIAKVEVPEIQNKLISAIENTDLVAVEECLKNGAYVKFVMPDGKDAISVATKEISSTKKCIYAFPPIIFIISSLLFGIQNKSIPNSYIFFALDSDISNYIQSNKKLEKLASTPMDLKRKIKNGLIMAGITGVSASLVFAIIDYLKLRKAIQILELLKENQTI